MSSVFDVLGAIFNPQNLKDDWQNVQTMPQQEEYSDYEDISEYKRIREQDVQLNDSVCCHFNE